MNVNSMMVAEAPGIYYNDSFRAVLEDHMNYLRYHSTSSLLDILPDVAYRYEFDFYGLLYEINVPVELHWITLRMNGYYSPTEVPSTVNRIIVPSKTTVSQIKQAYNTGKQLF